MDRHLHRDSSTRRLAGNRGLAIVEFAIVLPLLALLMAGIVEFGMAWRDELTVSNGTRAAARVVSNLGDNEDADYEALLTLNAALAGITDATVLGVLIYEASTADGEPPVGCFDASGNPQSSFGLNCNHYTAAELTSLNPADFSSGSTCGVLDQYWCPVTERSTAQQSLNDVGVWVRVDRAWLTYIFPGDGLEITDQSVMRVEPVTS